MTLPEALNAAAIGLLTGALGSLVAPWVNWGVEKRRLKRDDRKAAISRWRGNAQGIWIPHAERAFPSSDGFNAMKPHLSSETIGAIEAWVVAPSEDLRIEVQRLLNADLAALERKWELI